MRSRLLLCIWWLIVSSFAFGQINKDLRFAPVKQGILYRSAQPDEKGLKRLLNIYNFKTIIILRNLSKIKIDPRFQQELILARRHRLKIVILPISIIPDQKSLNHFLNIARDYRNWPILVHCEHGRSRTGALIAAYRVLIEGYNPLASLYEAYYYGYSSKNLKRLKDFLNTLKVKN